MRVLLLSPSAELDSLGGDVTYTETLLASPPPGVVYEDYGTALRSGALRERARRSSVQDGASPADWLELIRENALNRARGRGLLFREPFRYFTVDPRAYDLVHCHIFHAQLRLGDLPLVMSSGALQPDLYRHIFGWTDRKVVLAGAVDRRLARLLNVQQSSYSMPAAERVVCFTEHLARRLVESGAARSEQVVVVPAATPRGVRRKSDLLRGQVIGFVARDFVAKGGPVLLEAFELARQQRPDLALLVVGSEPRLSVDELRQRRITWLSAVPRKTLLDQLFPTMDVFAYPTNCDGGALVLQEALSCGVPAAVSDFGPMHEMVGYGRAGRVSPVGDAAGLAANILTMLHSPANERYRRGAEEVFEERYELVANHRRLGVVYEEALRSRRSS